MSLAADDPGSAAHAAETELLDLSAFAAARLEQSPYDHMVVPDLLPAASLAAVNRDYPDIKAPGNLSLHGLSYGPAFAHMVEELQSLAVAKAVGDKFGVDLTDCPTTITIRKFCEQSDGDIHTDHWSKVITGILYFNTDWSAAEGRLRLLRSKHDIEDYAVEVPPAGGTFLAFRRTATSFHGHKRFIGERRMLQINWVRSNRIARYVQEFDRLSTRLMKRVLRTGSTT